MNTVAAAVAEYTARGVVFEIDADGRLVLDAPRGVLTDADKRRIAERKQDIIRELRLSAVRREYARVDALLQADGRAVIHAGTVLVTCGLVEQVVKVKVQDARLRVDGFEGCVHERGCPEGAVLRCLGCRGIYHFTGLDDCAHGVEGFEI